MTSDRASSALPTPADHPQDEFARFQSDVQKAIEPLQNQIILREAAQSAWQEQLRQAGHAAASAERRTIFSVGTIMRIAVVSIGVAIAAISAERFLGTDSTATPSFTARFLEALGPGTPTNPGDLNAPPDHAALSPDVLSAEPEHGAVADQSTAQTQATSSDPAPQQQPAEPPPPSPTADDKDKAEPSKSAEDRPSSIDATVPAPADASSSSAVTMQPNDELELFRKFSEEQASREKAQALQEPPSPKPTVRQKAARHRHVQTARLALPSRNQGDRKDLGGEARQSARPAR